MIYIVEGVTGKPGILPVLRDAVMNYLGSREISPDRAGTWLRDLNTVRSFGVHTRDEFN